MDKSSGQGGNENWGGGNVFRARFTFAQEKRQSDHQAQQNGRDNGMEVRAIESEKGGRAPMEALAVEIREDSRGQDGNGGRARRPRKCGALQRVGSQGMSERVHGRRLSHEFGNGGDARIAEAGTGLPVLQSGRRKSGGVNPPLQGWSGRTKKRMHRSKDRPLQRRGGDEEFEGAGHDGEFDGKAGEGLAVNLSVDGILVEGFADQRIGFPEMNALCPAKIAHPERWQITKIAESALRREGHDLELISEEVRAGGDLEWSAVVCGATDDNQGGVGFLAADD